MLVIGIVLLVLARLTALSQAAVIGIDTACWRDTEPVTTPSLAQMMRVYPMLGVVRHRRGKSSHSAFGTPARIPGLASAQRISIRRLVDACAGVRRGSLA